MRAFIDKIWAILAERYQTRNRRRYFATYPQLVTYAYDYASIAINTHGRLETKVLDALQEHVFSHLPRDGICLDIGANIGNHALHFADHFAEVHCFEPAPKTFRLLSINAELKDNIICHAIGASDREAEIELIYSASNSGITRVAEPGENAYGQALRALVRPIDDVVPAEAHAQVVFVKVDVEGHELPALKGCARILDTAHPVIAFEVLEKSIGKDGRSVTEFLTGLGYRHFYELREPRPAWLPQWLPRSVRSVWKAGRLLFLGEDTRYAPHPITTFELRDYPLVIASHSPLPVS